MTVHKKNVLITGGTGFVGKAVLARIADDPQIGRIFMLVRPSRRQDARERVLEVITKMFPPGRVADLQEKIIAVAGDLVEKGLGLSPAERGKLMDVHQILHVGASTDFGAPLEVSRLNNVEGTRHVLDLGVYLSTHGALERFDYISTAYVAGLHKGFVTEESLDLDQEFSNTYEQSKYEAEKLVRSYEDRLPVCVIRPSIVVGDSRNGYTPHFKVLYWPLLILAKGFLPFIGCNPRAYLDVVPVDYVADGIVALMKAPEAIGRTFYLTAGPGGEIRIRDLLRDARDIAGIRVPPMIPYWLFNLIWKTPLSRLVHSSCWDAAELARPYFGYLLKRGVRFDSRASQEFLAGLGVQVPDWRRYRREVLTYCIASRWGRRLPMPEYAYYLPQSSKELQSHGTDGYRADLAASLSFGK